MINIVIMIEFPAIEYGANQSDAVQMETTAST